MKTIRRLVLTRLLLATAAGLVAAATAAGCAVTQPAGSPEGGTDIGAPAAASDLDRYRPADLAFFAALHPDGLALAAPPASLKAATADATAVVAAKVTGVRPTRAVADVRLVGVVLDVGEVLAGALRPETREVVVEFLVGSATMVDEDIAALRRSLPSGAAIWFLRWQGEQPKTTKPGGARSAIGDPSLYGLVHLEAVFAQGPRGALSATAEPVDAGESAVGMRAEAERFGTLTQLAAHIRGIK
jgi:hypothetical protein